jgi:glycosyltransferase involved in cell wall biosynthesis
MTELASVVILAHGHARLLPAAIQSALAQEDPAVEVLLVEHAPSDEVTEIVERFRDAPVRRVFSGGETPGDARNAGASAAKGALLAFLDADDLWPRGRLAVARAELGRNPELDAVFGRVRTFIDRGPIPVGDPDEAARLAGPPEAARLITTAVFRRPSFERVGPFEAERLLGSELDWIARAEDAGLRFGRLDEPVLLRRSHADNTTRTQRREYGDYARALKDIIDRRRGRT